MKVFNNVSLFVDYLSTHTTQEPFEGREYALLESEDHTKFTRTKSFEEAQRLLTFGDKETAKKLAKLGLVNVHKLAKQDKRRELYTSITGILPHVPNYIAGRPNNMINVRQRKVSQPVVNIFYDMNAHGGVPQSQILESSVKVAKAVLSIEAKGTRVNLYTGCFTEKGQQVGLAVRIKEAGQHVDVLKLCYPLCHPSFLRRHFFRFMEVTENISPRFVGSYGYKVNNEDKKKLAKQGGLKDVVIIDYYDAANAVDEQAVINLITKRARER